MRIFLSLLSIILASSRLQSVMDTDQGHLIDVTVTRLTQENFQRLTGIVLPYKMKANPFSNEWFVVFYSPSCPHCKKALPQWNKFSQNIVKGRKSNNRKVKIGAVNCVENYDLCKSFDIEGYPTFLYMTTDYKKYEFEGERTEEDFLSYINQQNFDPSNSYTQPDNMYYYKRLLNHYSRTTALIIVILLVLVGMLIYALLESPGKQYIIQLKSQDLQYKDMQHSKW